MAVLEAYTDESERDGVLCVAAYLGYSKDWSRFSKKWRSRLRKNDLTHFHMHEYMETESTLRKKLGKNADSFYTDLTLLIRKFTCKSFRFIIDDSEYHHATTKRFRSQFGSAFTFLTKAIVSYSYTWAKKDLGYRGLMNFVVERGHRGDAKVEQHLRELAKAGVIGSGTLGQKRLLPPLQAADILAYLTASGYNADYAVPAGRLPKVAQLYFTRELIREQVARVEEQRRLSAKIKNDAEKTRRLELKMERALQNSRSTCSELAKRASDSANCFRLVTLIGKSDQGANSA